MWSKAAPGRWSPTGSTDRGPDWCTRVKVAALDPFRGYQRALHAGLPEATVVLDAFHVVRLAQAAIDDVRRRVQHDTLGHRGRKGDPLYGIRRVLLRGAENLTEATYGRLLAGLAAGDPGGQVAAAYIAAQELRHLYAAPDLDRARRRLHRFYVACADPDVPELHRLGRTIAAWEDQLLAYFTTGGVSQRTHRGGQPPHQADQESRLRIPQLRELPAPAATALRRHLAHSHHDTDPRPVTTFYGVEPLCLACSAGLATTQHPRTQRRHRVPRRARIAGLPPIPAALMSSDALQVPSSAESCAFCDYLAGRRPFTVLHRTDFVATLVTREQRGVGHVLVIPIAHRPTLFDLTAAEAPQVMAEVIDAAKAITRAFQPGGVAVWQNNGTPAHQMIPHVHFHVAGTLPGGGTEFGDVPELPVSQTDSIAERLRPFRDDDSEQPPRRSR